MVWRTFILFVGLSTALADSLRSADLDALKALLPLLGDSVPLHPKIAVDQQGFQNIHKQNNVQQDSVNAKLEDLLQLVKPPSYSLFETPKVNNNNPPDRCSNSYYSVETLLPILSMFLEILDHTTQLSKARTVIELLKKYLDLAPESQEKNNFLNKLRNVEEHLLTNADNNGDDSTFQPPHVHKTTIVFDKELPGLDQQNCRETFGRLIQTAVNVYKETAKYPQCQPSGLVDENLYYPSNSVKPEKPYQFVVVYENPPTSFYTPDYSGISVLPKLNAHRPNVDHLYPNLFLEKQPVTYQLSSDLNQNKPSTLPEKYVPHVDILALIRQYNLLHPESPKNEKFYLELFRNLTGKPTNYPRNDLSPNNLSVGPLQSVVQGPLASDTSYPHVYALGPSHLPLTNNDPLQNQASPVSISNLQLPLHPPNNGVLPGTLFLKPVDHIHSQQNPASPVIHQIKVDNPQSTPELTLEILLSLLGNPDGSKSQIQLTPQILSQLVQYMRPNSPERKLLELQSANLSPNGNQDFVGYETGVGNNPQSLLEILNQQPDSQGEAFSGTTNPNSEALIKKLQQWLGVSNGDKLPPLQNKANVIELTYVLKRPKPLIYRPIYYVKYRLPYQTFIQNFQNLILKKQDMRTEPERVYEEVISVSNISDVSPSLKKLDKEEILKLVFGNGTLIDARVVDVPDSVLNKELEETRKMNAEVNPEVIEELNGNLGMNKSTNKSSSDRAVHWLMPTQATIARVTARVEDLTVNGLVTTSTKSTRLPEVKKPSPTTESPSPNSYHVYNSNQVLGIPSASAKTSLPYNVVPPVGYTKSSTRN